MIKEPHSHHAYPHHHTKLFKIAHAIVLFVFSVVVIVSSIKGFLRVGKSSDGVVDIANNWRTKAVMDVSVQTNCTDGFEEAFSYTWPGNKPGCYCGDVSNKENSKYSTSSDGLCTANQTDYGCVNIHSNPAVEIDSWSRIDGEPVKICVKRSQETWAEVGPKSGVTCPPNTIPCGQSPEYVFCSNGTKCPINDIQIFTMDIAHNAVKATECVYEANCLIIGRDEATIKVLEFKRGDVNDGLPLAQLRLNEYSMCNATEKDNIYPDRSDFYLLKTRRQSCGNEGVNLWTSTDAIHESTLFDINGLTPTIDYLKDFGYYPGSTSGDDYFWLVFSRQYLRWELPCREDMSTLLKRSNAIKNLKVVQLLQVIATCILGLLLGIVLPIMILADLKPGFTKNFNITGKLIQAPFQLLATSSALLYSRFFLSLVTRECSTPGVLSILEFAASEAHNAYKQDLVGLIALILAALFDLLLWLYVRSQIRKEEQYYPQVNVEQRLQNRYENELASYPQQGNQRNQYQGGQYPQGGANAKVQISV